MPGSFRIVNVNGLSVAVDINTVGSSPTEPDVFSDEALTDAVSLPVTITEDTTFYVDGTGGFTLSVMVDGTEVGPGEVFLTNQAPVTFSLDTDPRNTDAGRLAQLAAARFSAIAAGTTLGTVVGSIEVFDATGTSAGFLPVYDAIT